MHIFEKTTQLVHVIGINYKSLYLVSKLIQKFM
jgi:hypothetical protein